MNPRSILFRGGIAAAVLLGSLAVAATADAAPRILGPVVAIVNNPDASPTPFVAVAITGSGFGSQVSNSSLKVVNTTAPNTVYSYAATDSRVVYWTDDRIVIELPTTIAYPRVHVELSGGARSQQVTADRYTYEFFATNSGAAQSSGNPTPFTLTAKSATNGFLLEQWHNDLKKWSLDTGAVSKLSGYTGCPSPGCFAMQLFGDARTNTSVLGESVMVDPLEGRIWFTQGGWPGYTGTNPNHSRVVSYQPSNGTWKIYNVPGDDNEISGLAWTWTSPTAGRVWFSSRKRERCVGSCATAQQAKLVSFNPAGITHNNSLNFVTAVSGVTCNGGSLGSLPSTPPTVGTCSNASTRSCFTQHDCALVTQVYGGSGSDNAYFREYAVSDATQIGQLASDGGSDVWFTNHLGTTAYLGRLTVSTGTIKKYPVHYTAPNGFPVGPYRIAVASNGDVVFSHPSRHTLARLDASRLEDTACLSLVSPSTNCTTSPNGTCVNPCIDERVPAGYTAVNQQIGGLAEDENGKVWFTQSGASTDARYASSVGFWNGDRGVLTVFPSPQRYAASGETCNLLGIGTFGGVVAQDISVDPVTRDVWFTDQCRKRIGRLHALDGTSCD